jgi:hypothetical protein
MCVSGATDDRLTPNAGREATPVLRFIALRLKRRNIMSKAIAKKLVFTKKTVVDLNDQEQEKVVGANEATKGACATSKCVVSWQVSFCQSCPQGCW